MAFVGPWTLWILLRRNLAAFWVLKLLRDVMRECAYLLGLGGGKCGVGGLSKGGGLWLLSVRVLLVSAGLLSE